MLITNNKKIIALVVFATLGLVLLQIPVNVLAGSKVKFTLFDVFAPISGAFLGSPIGVMAVAITQTVNLVFHNFQGVDNSSILKFAATLRILPMIFAVWYFSKKDQKQLIIPILSIIIFNLHPIGRTVWFYSLFWLIPIIVWPFRERFLLLRALGSTFTAHSVGGAIWIWAFNLSAAVWMSLIPVVILERAVFALGISASYLLMNNLIAILSKKRFEVKGLEVDKKYLVKGLK